MVLLDKVRVSIVMMAVDIVMTRVVGIVMTMVVDCIVSNLPVLRLPQVASWHSFLIVVVHYTVSWLDFENMRLRGIVLMLWVLKYRNMDDQLLLCSADVPTVPTCRCLHHLQILFGLAVVATFHKLSLERWRLQLRKRLQLNAEGTSLQHLHIQNPLLGPTCLLQAC
jgi:hypothetical protein